MARKKFTTEQIIQMLRKAEIMVSQGKQIDEICRELNIHTQTYYRWRREYGGLELDQAKRFKDMEKENARLKRLVADLSLDNAMLKDLASGNF